MLQVRWSLHPSNPPRKKRGGNNKEQPDAQVGSSQQMQKEFGPNGPRAPMPNQGVLPAEGAWKRVSSMEGSAKPKEAGLTSVAMLSSAGAAYDQQQAPDEAGQTQQLFEPPAQRQRASAAVAEGELMLAERQQIADDLSSALMLGVESASASNSSDCGDAGSETDRAGSAQGSDGAGDSAVAAGDDLFDPLSLLSGDLEVERSMTVMTVPPSTTAQLSSTTVASDDSEGEQDDKIALMSIFDSTDSVLDALGAPEAPGKPGASSPTPSLSSQSATPSSPTTSDAARAVALKSEPPAPGGLQHRASLDLDLFAELDSLAETDLQLITPRAQAAPSTPQQPALVGANGNVGSFSLGGLPLTRDHDSFGPLDEVLNSLPAGALGAGFEMHSALEALTAESATLAKLDIEASSSGAVERESDSLLFSSLGLSGNDLFTFDGLMSDAAPTAASSAKGARSGGYVWTPALAHLQKAQKPLASQRWLEQERPDLSSLADGLAGKKRKAKAAAADKCGTKGGAKGGAGDNCEAKCPAKKSKKAAAASGSSAAAKSNGSNVSWQLSWRMTSWEASGNATKTEGRPAAAGQPTAFPATQQLAMPYNPCAPRPGQSAQTPTTPTGLVPPGAIAPPPGAAKPPSVTKEATPPVKSLAPPRTFSWQTLKIFPQKKDAARATAAQPQQQQPQTVPKEAATLTSSDVAATTAGSATLQT